MPNVRPDAAAGSSDDEPPRPPEQRRRGPALLTPAEAASLLHVDSNTLARWSESGRLTAVRTPGGHRRYLASEIVRLARRRARSSQGA